MPQYQVDIEKRLGTEFWTNVYLIDTTDNANATVFAGLLTDAEIALHKDIVTFTRYRVRSVSLLDDWYVVSTIGANGSRTTGGPGLPLFNTLRFDINAVSGRPSRKYYRGVLGESDINGDVIETDFSSFTTAFEDLFGEAESGGWKDPQLQVFSEMVQHPFVQMRQLRRSSRRRTNGGGIFQ